MKRILALAVLILALTACGGESETPPTTTAPAAAETEATATIEPEDTATPTPKPTDRSEPTSTTAPPTLATSSTSAAIPDDFASGGLGLSRELWEQAHTQSSEGIDGFINYDDNSYSVGFLDGNVWQLMGGFDASLPTLDEARAEGEALIPEDSQLVETFTPEHYPELTVDWYLSESLKDRFGPDAWLGAEPGNFLVMYSVYDDGVSGFRIHPGAKP